MGLSRLRWVLALAVAVVALGASVSAVTTYLDHRLMVGVLAVAALAVTLVAGLGSLALARRRIGAELQALAATPARGDLLTTRRRRLAAIKASGVRADQDVLADVAAADEAGRAYIGRYLVATTVLIGLVGTFAGLMETLGKVAPLLAQKDADVLALLGAPLGGLHVTFGASLVAILATLALALAQGDLALHEQQALALLEDRTRHDLVPELWPPAEEPAERAAQALDELRSDLARVLGTAIAETLEKSSRRLADSARSESERAARALEATASTIEKQMTRLGSAVEAAITEGTRRQGAALTEATAAALRESNRVSEESARRSSKVAEEAVKATSAELGRALVPLLAEESQRLESVRAALASGAEALSNTAGRMETIGGQLEQLTRTQAQALESTSQAVIAGLAASARENAAALEAASQAVVASLDRALAGSAATLEATGQAVVAGLDRSVAGSTAALESASQAVVERLERSLSGSAAALESASHAVAAGLDRSMQESAAALQSTSQAIVAGLDRSVQESAAALQSASQAVVTGLEASLQGSASTLEATGQAVIAGLDRSVVASASALDGAARQLAEAAQSMRGGTETLGPRLEAVAREMGALGREVALLAARGAEGDLGAVVLGELERLGAGFDQLSELVRLSRGGEPTPAGGEISAPPAVAEAAPEETAAVDVPAAGETELSATFESHDEDLLPADPVVVAEADGTGVDEEISDEPVTVAELTEEVGEGLPPREPTDQESSAAPEAEAVAAADDQAGTPAEAAEPAEPADLSEPLAAAEALEIPIVGPPEDAELVQEAPPPRKRRKRAPSEEPPS